MRFQPVAEKKPSDPWHLWSLVKLDAASVLMQRGRTDIKILLIGQGMQKRLLQNRADLEGIGNVIFHDPVNKERLSSLMAGTDVGLQILANIPSFYYGTSPNKFFDYIAAGLPVLTNYPGWVADLVVENRCGFAVEPDSPEAFADALECAADNRTALKGMGQSSRALAKRQFDRHLLADEWVDWVSAAVRKD